MEKLKILSVCLDLVSAQWLCGYSLHMASVVRGIILVAVVTGSLSVYAHSNISTTRTTTRYSSQPVVGTKIGQPPLLYASDVVGYDIK